MSRLGQLAAAALLALAGSLRADAALEARVLARLQAQAAALSCAAQAWTEPLRALEGGWQADEAAALPAPGAWAPLAMTVRRGSESRELALKLKLWPCALVRVLSADKPAGAALSDADVAWELRDPRSLGGVALGASPLAGAKLTRPRLRGEALLAGDVSRVLLLAGAAITLKVRFAGGEASDQGYLMEDGVEGKLLRAGHTRTGKVVTGRLVDGALLVED
jgi:flagella basal body P-ring formation protein FlgA